MSNNGKIEAHRMTVKDLFSDFWFKIPGYQRPYVWGKDEVVAMLDDISERAVEDNRAEYFLGSFVLHGISNSVGAIDYKEFDVLDGQQRLTTLYLILACVRDYMFSAYEKLKDSKDLAEEAEAKDINEFVSKLQTMIVQAENTRFQTPFKIRLKHEVKEDVDRFFEKHVCRMGGITGLVESLDRGIVSRSVCQRHIEAIELINSFFKRIDECKLDANFTVDKFAQYLIHKVIVIYVSAGSFDDAFRFFTVLNNRGIPLSASDILKATNLGVIGNPDDAKKWAAVWEDAESSFSTYGSEGLDQLLSYIRSILIKDKQRETLLKEFNDRIYGAKPPKLKKGIATFEAVKEYKEIYDSLIMFDGQPSELAADFRYRNVVTVMLKGLPSKDWVAPILLWYKKFGSLSIVPFVEQLSHKVAADFILGLTPSERIININKLLRAIDAADVFGPLPCLVVNPEKPLGYDHDRLNEILSNDIYGKRYALYVLLRLELDKQSDQQALNLPLDLSIEHILPQNPKPDSSWCSIFSEEQRIKYIDKIGNLTLIGRRKNSSLGNRDFNEKKK